MSVLSLLPQAVAANETRAAPVDFKNVLLLIVNFCFSISGDCGSDIVEITND